MDFADYTLQSVPSCSFSLCISWKLTAGSRHRIRFNPFGRIIISVCSDSRHVMTGVSFVTLIAVEICVFFHLVEDMQNLE